MIRSRIVPAQEGFAKLTEQLEARVVEGLDAAAEEAAVVAQAGASINLEVETIPAHGTADGYAAGIKARKQSSNKGQTTPIAEFFDAGTLGKRRRKLKGRRKESWQVRRRGGTYTAERGAITAEMGIKPQRFFVKARKAGRARLLEVIHRQ